MGKWMIAAASVLALPVGAPARTALVAAGRCEDPELLSWSAQMAGLLREQTGQQLLGEDELTGRFRWAARPVAELERQLEGATREYFQAEYGSADRRALEALAEVEHLRPGPRRWQLYVRGLLLRALILRARNRSGEAAEQIRRVLSVDPNHRLDSDYFPPSMRAAFDRLRRQLLSQPKAALAITSTPTGAAIFIDGLELKRVTPATVTLVPGRYSIAVSKDGHLSFPRTVDLPSSSSLHLDLDFDSSIRPGLVPCLEDQGDEQLHLTKAVKLGKWLGVDRVVLIGTDRRQAGETWVSASLLDVQSAQKIRGGETKVSNSAPSSSALAELAEVVSTGDPSRSAHEPELATSSPPAVQQVAGANHETVPTALPTAEARADPVPTSSSKTWTKVFGSTLTAAGALAVGGGVLLQVRSDQSWANLGRRYADGTPPTTAEVATVQSIRKQADWQRRAAIASYALGATAVCTGVLLILSGSGHAGAAEKAIRTAPGALSIEGSW